MLLRIAMIIFVIFSLVGTSYAAQWPVTQFLTKGGVENGQLAGTEGDSKQLSSDFGPRTLTDSAMHCGVDIPVGDGTQVFAVAAGTVDFKGWTSNGGYIIRIKGDDGRFYEYMHLLNDEDVKIQEKYGIAPLVDPNDKNKKEVKEGQQIGWSDSTVNEDGTTCRAHLHLDVYTVGTGGERLFVNPLTVLPYQNTEIPKVEILTPENNSVVGATADTEEVDIQVKVTAKEKDVSQLVLSIDGIGSEILGVNFNFEKEGRKNVIIDIKGEKYISKGGKWVKATDDELKNLPSYVQTALTADGKTDDTINTFIYKWNTKAFLDSQQKSYMKDVPIKAAAKQAQGPDGVAEITVDMGCVVPTIKTVTVDATKMIASGQMTYVGVKNATVKSTIGAQEQGALLTAEMLKGKVVLKTASTEQVLTPTIIIKPDGTAEASAQATGLEDGMHTATVEVLDDSGQVIDSKQKLFMVDTTPPEILKDKLEDIVTRTGIVFLPMALLEPGTYFYAIPFKEEGSGVARIEVLEAGGVRTIEDQFIHRSGASPDFNLAVNEAPFGSRVLTVRIYDQAGNVGEKTFSFKSSKAPVSREIGKGPLEGSKKIRQYCYATQYGGTYDPAPSSFYITGGRVGHGGIDMNTPLYIKTNKHTTAQSASAYLAVTLNGVDGKTGWKTWKVTQTKPTSGSLDPGFVQLVGPLYIDFTIMEKDMSIIGVDPGPSVTAEFVLGFELAALCAGLGYNSEANALDARWENRQAQDLVFVLTLDGSDVLPTVITADAFRYTPIAEGSHQVVLSIYDRILNGWGKLERGFSVNLGEPKIADFAYITEDGVFKALITDKGTALRDLEIEFYLNGEKSLFEFDKTTGELTGFLYDPPDQGTVTAQLFVTDKAGNRVSSLAKARFYTSTEGVTTGGSVSIDPADVQIGGTVKTTTGNCTKTYQREDQCRVTVIEECTWYNVFGGLDQLDPMTAKDLPKTEGNKLPNIAETTTTTKKYVDICPPSISDLRYDEASRTVRARISDRNTPLAALRIQYGGSAILGNEWYDLRNPSFDFSTATGEFVGDLPGEETEIYHIRLSVDDRDNKTYGNLSIRDPKKPPEVILYFDDFSHSANAGFLNAFELEHLLVGEYSDASGIDEGRTELEIDGVIKRNFITYSLGQISTRLIYRADLAEGRHRARLRVADTLGLENETYLVFDIAYKPHIQRFVYQGQVEGVVPIFVAFIKDQGYDVTLQGITLLLDGKEIPRSQCYYNQETGFFSVTGPLEIAAGAHQAELTAIDSQGNQAEETISFGGPLAEEVLAEAVGGVRITGYSAWDVQGNGDGRINPGERVRLFVEVLADMDIPQAKGQLRIPNPSITIEQGQAAYGDIPKGRRTESIGAFELVIKDDFFRNINSQEETIACTLTLTDQAGKVWALPFRITVYRPLEIFREAQGPAEGTSVSLEIIQPQDGVEYWANPPVTVEGRFTVTGSSLDFIIAELACDRWWLPIDVPLSVNEAARTFSGPLRSLRSYWPRGHYTLTFWAGNSAGDWLEKTIRFSIDKLE